MATFEYVEIPADAVRLKPTALEPATKVLTSLPDTTSTSSRLASEPLSPTKSALTLVPQMLLSPPSFPTASVIASAIATPNPRSTSHSLLSTRDPLSVPIVTANFRRFVSRIGPVFWLQDRVEEIILWRKGWKRTVVWLFVYGFFCYFPKMTLLLPHIVLLSVMLAYYPEPGAQPVPITLGEGTADWQANIQAIQNLMGAYSDAHDAVVPLLPFLVAPSPPKSMSTDPTSKSPRHPPTPSVTTQPHHPFLIVTLVTFLLLIPLLMTDLLPLRLLFFLAGAGGVCALHPHFRGSLSPVSTALSGSGPGLSLELSISIPRLPNPLSLLPIIGHRLRRPQRPTCTLTTTLTFTPRDALLFLRRLVDNDRLDDAVWNAPMTEVELWENERWVQDASDTKRRKSALTFVREGDEDGGEDDAASTTSSGTATTATLTGHADATEGPTLTGGTWSKANLKANERVGWTRGRDGWSGVGGQVSNLTFSLSPGWAFVETEGWRPDLVASWAVENGAPCTSVCVGADEDGWTYTTDTWTHPRPDRRTCDGWVTRRRRWIRRIYFKGVAS